MTRKTMMIRGTSLKSKTDYLQWENNYQVLDQPPNYERFNEKGIFFLLACPSTQEAKGKNVSKIYKCYCRPGGYWEPTGASRQIKSCGWIISWPLKYSAAIMHSHDQSVRWSPAGARQERFLFVRALIANYGLLPPSFSMHSRRRCVTSCPE